MFKKLLFSSIFRLYIYQRKEVSESYGNYKKIVRSNEKDDLIASNQTQKSYLSFSSRQVNWAKKYF